MRPHVALRESPIYNSTTSALCLLMQVVSDIDDTLMCSGGSYPAGRDMRYPHNCVYPGILAFYNELDVGHVQRSEMQVKALWCSALADTCCLCHVLEFYIYPV